MRFFLKFLLKIAANAAALWVADRYISGFDFGPFLVIELPMPSVFPMPWLLHWQTIIALGIAFALLNLLLRPILKFAGALLPLASFAILSIALNAALLWITDFYLAEVSIAGWRPLALASLLLGAVNFFL